MRLIDADILKRKTLEEIAGRSSDTPENRIAKAWLKKFVESIDKQDSVQVVPKAPRGLYECFHCGAYAVSWDADFDFADYGYDGEGIVQECHCNNCGANITYLIDCSEPNDDEEKTEGVK